MSRKETPEVVAAVDLLLERWGEEPWFFDAREVRDDAGARLLVEVVDVLYVDDVLPRKLGDAFLVVQRVSGGIVVEEAPPHMVGKA